MTDKQVELKIDIGEEKEDNSQSSELLFGENLIWTSDPRVEIKRQVEDNIEPTNLKTVLENTVAKWGNNPAYTYETGNVKVTKTWEQFAQDINNFACALIHHDLDSLMLAGLFL